MSETGPIYNVPLIETLPIPGSSMRQAMPQRFELELVAKRSQRTVAGYEVLLCHWHNQNERIKELTAFVREVVADLDASQAHCDIRPEYADMLKRGLELLGKVDGEGSETCG